MKKDPASQKVPVHSWLSLAGALSTIAKLIGKSPLSDSAVRGLYGALCDGDVAAIGDFEDLNGRILTKNQSVTQEQWQHCITEAEFGPATSRHRVLNLCPNAPPDKWCFLVNVWIETQSLDKWINGKIAHIGRPKGAGAISSDTVAVESALKMMNEGKAKSGYDAAQKLAGNVNDPGYKTKVERLRKKIAKAAAARKKPRQ